MRKNLFEGINEENIDEEIEATIKLGEFDDGVFHEKYKYSFTIKEGLHNYLIRISADYYWYSDNINMLSLECGGNIYIQDMCILEGA